MIPKTALVTATFVGALGLALTSCSGGTSAGGSPASSAAANGESALALLDGSTAGPLPLLCPHTAAGEPIVSGSGCAIKVPASGKQTATFATSGTVTTVTNKSGMAGSAADCTVSGVTVTPGQSKDLLEEVKASSTLVVGASGAGECWLQVEFAAS